MPTLDHPPCPLCHSHRIWKDGIRYTRDEEVQRYICRDCGHRFSETSIDKPENYQSNRSYRPSSYIIDRQICVLKPTGAKNLAEVETRQKRAAGATTPDSATIKGLIVQFAFWLQKEGHENSSYPQILKRLVNNSANLLDPESVKEIIAKRRCKDATKILEVYAYDAFTKMLNIQWSKPHYTQEEILPFIPEERELDQLIAACKSRRMATFLQTLKETFADPGEALKLRWTDLTGNVLTIRSVKGHRPRQLTISSKLVAMLQSLPRKDERIFPTTYTVMNKIFWRMKNRVANITNNPRLKAITFTTFRHWGATMIYHQTRNLLLVQKILGHKRITSTMKYTQLIPLKEDEYDVTAATSIDEDQELLKAGFEYVTERNGIKLYRRPKVFAKYMDNG